MRNSTPATAPIRDFAFLSCVFAVVIFANAHVAFANPPTVTVEIGAAGSKVTLDPSLQHNLINAIQAKGPISVMASGLSATGWTASLIIGGRTVINPANIGNATPITRLLHPPLADGPTSLVVELKQGRDTYSLTYPLIVDTKGPQVIDHYVTGDPQIGLMLSLVFQDDDFGDVGANAFTYTDLATNTVVKSFGQPFAEQNIIRIPLNRPPFGTYRVTIIGTGNTPLTDRAGNPAGDGKDQDVSFTTTAQSEPGKHVEFPRFIPAKQLLQGEFNPGDFVETRVARLYYFRDAHRVAQLINRTARPHRAAEVAQAERRAAEVRGEADRLTDRRRDTELQAEEVGRRLRATEQRLGQAQEQLNQKVEESTAPAASPTGSTAPPAPSTPTVEQTKQIDKLEQTVSDLRQEVRGLQDEAAKLRLLTQQHQAQEDRARENQFRLEVASAHEDPDTYAAGNLDSVDSVSQVSVSVIGEGLIQLRGPIAGINKIRTMIDQIDSPLGQVRVDVITVQLNGEDGHRLEEPVARVNGYIDLGRFLTSQSLALLRRAIQTEAARVAAEANSQYQGNYQVDRDRRYVYSFFGRDFIDELYEMDSEFLHTENKLLTLHSMDTLSLNQALFILSLARRDVRANILATFQTSILEELPQAEWDYRRSAGLIDKHHHALVSMLKNKHRSPEPRCLEEVFLHASEKYHFRNFTAMFDGHDTYSGDPDIMTPLQREFLRLAQIFKARMVAEVEIKQRVIERGLIESKRQDSFEEEEALKADLRKKVIKITKDIQTEGVEVAESLSLAANEFDSRIRKHLSVLRATSMLAKENYANYKSNASKVSNADSFKLSPDEKRKVEEVANQALISFDANLQLIQNKGGAIKGDDELTRLLPRLALPEVLQETLQNARKNIRDSSKIFLTDPLINQDTQLERDLDAAAIKFQQRETLLVGLVAEFLQAINPLSDDKVSVKERMSSLQEKYELLRSSVLMSFPAQESQQAIDTLDETHVVAMRFLRNLAKKEVADHFLVQTRINVDHKKLLDFLIDEKQDKFIELQEGTRAHIAWMDNYLKRLAIALEDDFKVQFYEPAFVRIRSNARTKFVTLSQIERTSILTNNRAFGKVSPQATMEFDLPKRKLALVEAFDAAKAVAQDAGALLNDPTFLATFQMMGGGPVGTQVQGVLPSLPSSTDQAIMGITGENTRDIGAALQALVPPPAIYKFETGTGYEIRPVIQPDGHSVMFDFLYMYTTNIREPVGGDEKHLGRVRRHFIDTQVQLSSFEMRELSRYQVALKVARTAQGVPLLQDIPLLGVAFRPLPSQESSIQQNVILGQTVVYPTLFDLMGLRWAPAVIDLNHTDLRNLNHVVRGRNRAMEDAVFRISSESVDEMLDLRRRSSQHVRPDLYHPQRAPSPYHPNGYRYETDDPNFVDPTGQQFEQPDRRPVEFQMPPYDSRFRRPIRIERMPPSPGLNFPSTPWQSVPIEEAKTLEFNSQDEELPPPNTTIQPTVPGTVIAPKDTFPD